MMKSVQVTTAVFVALLCGVRGQGLDLASYENCEALDPQIKLGWTVDRGNSTVSFLLCGCRQENLVEQYVNQYVAFGLSGNQNGVSMEGGDVTVAWIDAMNGQVSAVDYFLESYSQCREGRGVCPDTDHVSGQCTNDIVPGSVQGQQMDGIQCIAFQKPFTTSDSTCDLTISPDDSQYVIWAIGGIEETAFKHFIRTDTTAAPISLGRAADNKCAGVSIECPICQGFSERTFNVTKKNAVFVATVGPTGGQRGYTSIAGHAGWGFSWYINGTLIPRLIVSRGYTYTFISEGGVNSTVSSQYHPFYLTSSATGGRLQNRETQRAQETVYAGFAEDGSPLGLGPYCEYTETASATSALNDCGTFQEYLDGLTRGSCPPLDSLNLTDTTSFTWTPDQTTPNTIYYQCATHRGFGYRITVEPPLDNTSAAAGSMLSTFFLFISLFINVAAMMVVL